MSVASAINIDPPVLNALSSVNITGGIASQIPYQSAPNTTAFIPNGTAGQVLTSAGTSAPTWTTPALTYFQYTDTTPSSTSIPVGITSIYTTPTLSAGTYLFGVSYNTEPLTNTTIFCNVYKDGTTPTNGGLNLGFSTIPPVITPSYSGTATSATPFTLNINLGGSTGSQNLLGFSIWVIKVSS